MNHIIRPDNFCMKSTKRGKNRNFQILLINSMDNHGNLVEFPKNCHFMSLNHLFEVAKEESKI